MSDPCPTCSWPSRETSGLVCQTCGWDYANGEKPTQPAAQWWVINGGELMAALERAHEGDAPWVVYAELIANSEPEDA